MLYKKILLLDAILIDYYSFSDKPYAGYLQHFCKLRANLRYYVCAEFVWFWDLPFRKNITRTVAIENKSLLPLPKLHYFLG